MVAGPTRECPDGGRVVRPLWVLVSLTAVALIVAGGVVLSMPPPSVSQPLAFNHYLHVEDLGAYCTDCHLYAVNGVRATIPNYQTCADCHDAALTESPVEARLIEYIEAGEPIPWRKIYWVPDHVFFSHRRHTAVAELECEVCHGEVGSRVEPLDRALVPITMEGCMDCHERSGASNDCIVCHR